ncbi:hypothetical protein DO233_23335 [Salmonella enterica]|uniref:Uncharacterized protein n=1 Tax=Salmonella enterica subsp. arizonae TaxID=59203 RepID=A0A379T9S2_SALER|nr:hypothetical protein [Salmonella enterica]SUG47053.1 Uncharacterised protein [Salmonella enterica subsp. arizonae]
MTKIWLLSLQGGGFRNLSLVVNYYDSYHAVALLVKLIQAKHVYLACIFINVLIKRVSHIIF